MGQRKNSEFPWGIEPQTFGFCTAMLYHWATETLWWVRPITKFIHDTRRAHCGQWISGSAMSIVWALLTLESLWLSGRALECAIQRSEVQLFFFVPHLWQDKKRLSLFLYQVLNLSSFLLYEQRIFSFLMWAFYSLSLYSMMKSVHHQTLNTKLRQILS